MSLKFQLDSCSAKSLAYIRFFLSFGDNTSTEKKKRTARWHSIKHFPSSLHFVNDGHTVRARGRKFKNTITAARLPFRVWKLTRVWSTNVSFYSDKDVFFRRNINGRRWHISVYMHFKIEMLTESSWMTNAYEKTHFEEFRNLRDTNHSYSMRVRERMRDSWLILLVLPIFHRSIERNGHCLVYLSNK